MTKIYDALRRAEQEQTPPGQAVPRLRVETRNHALRQKLIAVYQTIESALPDKQSRVVMFLGSRRGEGASVLVRELARLASSELAQRVALIDLTPGSGGHYEYFGAALHASLNDVIAGRAAINEAVEPLADNPALALGCVATGETSASLVVASPQFHDQIAAIKERYSLILFDAPSIAESSDALLAAPETDGIVMVVEAGSTRWQVAENAREKLAMQGGNVLGVILNKRRFYIPSFIYRRL